MAKIKKVNNGMTDKNTGDKLSFEQKLERLETLGDEIRKNDIPLDQAVKAFEEGIVLARTLQKDLEKLEGRIEILMNGANVETDLEEEVSAKAELGLFDEES